VELAYDEGRVRGLRQRSEPCVALLPSGPLDVRARARSTELE